MTVLLDRCSCLLPAFSYLPHYGQIRHHRCDLDLMKDMVSKARAILGRIIRLHCVKEYVLGGTGFR